MANNRSCSNGITLAIAECLERNAMLDEFAILAVNRVCRL